MRAHWRRHYIGQEASAPQNHYEANTVSLALGIVHIPANGPPKLFGDNYCGITVLGAFR